MSMDDMGTEYVYPPEKWVQAGHICAAEEQWATHKELDAAVSDVCDVQDELEARIVAIETQMAWLHSQVRPELPQPQCECSPEDACAIATERDTLQAKLESLRAYKESHTYTDGVRDGAEAAHDAMSPAIEAMRAELDALRAKWQSVPWAVLNYAAYLALLYVKYYHAKSLGDDTDYDAALRTVGAWLDDNAPEEATE